MRMKEVPCPECGGHGVIVVDSEYSISGKQCDSCYGTGKKEVPFTNLDHYRSLSEKELAKILPCPYIHDEYGECKYGWHLQGETCDECILEWLGSPYEEK